MSQAISPGAIRAHCQWARELIPAPADRVAAAAADLLLERLLADAARLGEAPTPGALNDRVLEIARDLDPHFGNGALWMRVAHLYWASCFGQRERHWEMSRLRRQVVRWYFEVASPSPEPWSWEMPPSVRAWLADAGIRTRRRRSRT